MKRVLNLAVLVLVIAIIAVVAYGMIEKDKIDDEQELTDSDFLQLDDSKVRVNFSEVILSPQNETRELIVSTQEATVTADLEDRVIKQLDIDALKRSQSVNYTGTGYFVVNLNTLTEKNITVDDVNKRVIIQIEHAKLKDIVIDPNKVKVGAVKKGVLALGNLEITVKDYNQIEQQLIDKLKAKFNTGENLQEVDDYALEMVKEIYEPVVRAVDISYTVVVTF